MASADFIKIKEIETELFELNMQKKRTDADIKIKEAELDGLLVDCYSLTEASNRLDISLQSMLRRIKSGKYEGVNIANRWYIQKSDVDDEMFLKDRKEMLMGRFE